MRGACAEAAGTGTGVRTIVHMRMYVAGVCGGHWQPGVYVHRGVATEQMRGVHEKVNGGARVFCPNARGGV